MHMPTGGAWRRGLRAAASAAVGLLLVGGTATQAHADSTRSQQWFLDAMHAEEMWRTSTGEGITVAVIDTGVDPTNPDLKGRVLDGKDLAPAERAGDEHTDYEGHGTGMAGLIAGTGAYGGGKGAFGLAPGAKILPIRVPSETEDQMGFGRPAYFSKAIRYAADQHAQVINISMGSSVTTSELTAAVKYAVDHGSLIFASVGNEAEKGNPDLYPANTPGVVGVASVGKNLRRSSFSEYGPQVDISAPGEDMVHACGGKTGLCKTEGTSDATALASASAALIWSQHPTWTNNQVLRVMLNTIGGPTDGAKRNDSIGYGIVRPRIALKTPGDPGPADVYPLPDLAAAASPSSSPSAKSPAPKGDSGSEPNRNTPTAASSAEKDDDGDAMLWIALGVGAVVVLGGGAAAVVLARRRRSAPKLSREHAAAAATQYLNSVAYPDRAGTVTVLPATGTDYAYGWTFQFDFAQHAHSTAPTNTSNPYVIVVPHSGATPHFPPAHLPTAQYMAMCAAGDQQAVRTH
ncbi:type VII secretion-associated serine protease mycosin [Streptomyces sp. GMY01]|uniref:type VII secretion-associated serine protease mycosin n=1 Tax=Streptomyces sp. GMY02 TaxID=1333528 RepID=UPI00146BB7C1|nr:type VII secretion-associated serine protease mycosin [Streptomyces sp. GMY02]NMO38087.1 type VII secretion-associated serine protease mycosin [Streptomyces sp. GMY02]